MIRITATISLHEDEIRYEFVRSSGPGGQNVNKVTTAVQLRFDIRYSTSLPQDIKQRLIESAGKRVSGDGVLIIDARRFRSQERNRAAALARLTALIEKAATLPKQRRLTRPSPAAQERRLQLKHQRSLLKQTRRHVSVSDGWRPE